ncbi:MAG: sigma-54-dependent Fis family transcriptional regulator [Deltaproteobacteria bacterium]|nr:sigma-54-dependent Fis family transcriptional regulator [Deltaproteobacteria bacterium]MBW1870418.1 sigma-54-dependent Fis family transcriptional regulator [Deltaproteobacteria bacterium]
MSSSENPSVLHSVADMLSKQVTKDRLLRAMVDRVVEELDAERGTLYLIDAITGELTSRVAHLPELKEIRLPPGQGVAGHVAETGKSVVVPDASSDSHFFPGIDKATGYKTRNMLVVPIRDDEDAIRGVLQVLNRKQGNFTDQDKLLLDSLADQVAQALELTSLRPIGDRARGVLVDGPFNNIIGECRLMTDLYDRILAAATTDVTVLIRGDSGTGKTLVARAIHDNSERHDGPMVHVDCTTLPAGLIESELFGHERGAFTGADRRVQGKFELADGGTLFLDEIGDLPLPLQGKLLRFLQEHAFERLGGRQTIKTDVRVVSATNANLEEKVAQGLFRQDLYYRLRVLELTVPPLKDRGPKDIERLAEHFLDQYARRHRRKARRLSREALARLVTHDWPGNVRELEHCIQSAVVLSKGTTIDQDQLSLPGTAGSSPAKSGYLPGTPLAEVERDHIQRTVESCGGNRTEAARKLGIGRNTLARKLK